MTCTVIALGPDFAAWQCTGNPEVRWIADVVAQQEAQQAAAELEEDLAIALALDPYEEAPVAMEDAFWCEVYYPVGSV